MIWDTISEQGLFKRVFVGDRGEPWVFFLSTEGNPPSTPRPKDKAEMGGHPSPLGLGSIMSEQEAAGTV